MSASPSIVRWAVWPAVSTLKSSASPAPTHTPPTAAALPVRAPASGRTRPSQSHAPVSRVRRGPDVAQTSTRIAAAQCEVGSGKRRKCAICRQFAPIVVVRRFSRRGLLSRGSQVRVLPGAPRYIGRMPKTRFRAAALAALTASLAIPAAAWAQDGPPPPPTAANGAVVKTLAQGLPTPTDFAFYKRNVFVSAFGSEDGSVRGGVFRVRKGEAKRLKGSPRAVAGLAWRNRKLYVSANKRIVVMSRWNGRRFLRSKTIYRGPEGFTGFSGLAFGPDGRPYSGVQLNDTTDQKPDTGPFARSIVSLKPNGTDIRVVATGLRQPWQLTFVKGNPAPFVSVLADERTPTPPDWIVNAKPGENYGYPTCTQAAKRPCKGFAKPVALLDDHASPMGISPIGQTLYVALFGGLGQGPVVVSMNTAGKQIKPFLSGYVAPVLAVGTRRGYVYTGDLTGAIYRVKAAG